ncbi:hypothetical protein PMI30_05174 [Pseudomonas sp. GM50]|jgi:hypothetical protein|nr:hypothetical protein PMI30_05174 [Pseudomonas sp. GM50]
MQGAKGYYNVSVRPSHLPSPAKPRHGVHLTRNPGKHRNKNADLTDDVRASITQLYDRRDSRPVDSPTFKVRY